MKKFTVKIQREFEVTVEATTLEVAEQLARRVVLQFPVGTAKLMSILPEGYREPADPPKPTKPFGKPTGGGSPGTPTIKVSPLVDQIAEAA